MLPSLAVSAVQTRLLIHVITGLLQFVCIVSFVLVILIAVALLFGAGAGGRNGSRLGGGANVGAARGLRPHPRRHGVPERCAVRMVCVRVTEALRLLCHGCRGAVGLKVLTERCGLVGVQDALSSAWLRRTPSCSTCNAQKLAGLKTLAAS